MKRLIFVLLVVFVSFAYIFLTLLSDLVNAYLDIKQRDLL